MSLSLAYAANSMTMHWTHSGSKRCVTKVICLRPMPGSPSSNEKAIYSVFLLLFVCFMVMAMLVGLVYKVTAERAGRQSLDDLMKVHYH